MLLHKRKAFVFSVLSLLCSCAAPRGDDGFSKKMKVYDIQIQSGESEKVLPALNQLNYENPQNCEILLRLGQANAALGRNNAASVLYKKSLRLCPDLEDGWKGLSHLYMKTDSQKALAVLGKMRTLYPGDADILNDYGVALDLNGRYQEAQASYKQAIATDPTLVSAEVNLGLSMVLSGQKAEGLALIRPYAMATDATIRTRENYALALLANGRTDDARVVLGASMAQDQVPGALKRLTEFLRVHAAG